MRRCALVAFSVAFLLADLSAVGTVTAVGSPIFPGAALKRYIYAWTSDASGAVSGDTTTIISPGGYLAQIAFVPGSGGTQPSNAYDVTLLNSRSVDVLTGMGANLSNAATTELTADDVFIDQNAALQLVVANAGNAKTGQVVIWYRTR